MLKILGIFHSKHVGASLAISMQNLIPKNYDPCVPDCYSDKHLKIKIPMYRIAIQIYSNTKEKKINVEM